MHSTNIRKTKQIYIKISSPFIRFLNWILLCVLCKRSSSFQAQTATLTIAQAFNLAFDKWKQGNFIVAKKSRNPHIYFPKFWTNFVIFVSSCHLGYRVWQFSRWSIMIINNNNCNVCLCVRQLKQELLCSKKRWMHKYTFFLINQWIN